MRRLAVSIINYRTGALTLDAVRSVRAEMEGIDGEIVVVDNASGDGSADEIARWIAAHPDGPPVRLVRSATNTGFSGGHNQGIAAVEAEHHLVHNSDALLRPGCLSTLLAAADAMPRTGLFAPRLEWETGDVQISCFRFHSPLSEFIRGTNSGPIRRAFGRWDVSLGTDPDPAEIGWVSFACILLRGAMVREIGPMDEGYFLYFEDAEYCLRARRAGWGIAYIPTARAVHHRGGSAPVKSLARDRKRLPAYFYRSRARFLIQAHGRGGLLAANLLWHTGRVLAQTRRLLGKTVPRAAEAEARDIWQGFAAPLAPDTAGREP